VRGSRHIWARGEHKRGGVNKENVKGFGTAYGGSQKNYGRGSGTTEFAAVKEGID